MAEIEIRIWVGAGIAPCPGVNAHRAHESTEVHLPASAHRDTLLAIYGRCRLITAGVEPVTRMSCHGRLGGLLAERAVHRPATAWFGRPMSRPPSRISLRV